MKIIVCTNGIWAREEKKKSPDSQHLLQKTINILCQYRRTHNAHTAPLQPHPPLPCTYLPSPAVNCIPLDDITGNKRQQQDNKRFELQSSSFISDFITPPLMDVDLYTLPQLACSIPQPPPPPPFSHFFSLAHYPLVISAVIYDALTNTSPSINISITVKRSGWTLMQRYFGELSCCRLQTRVYDFMKLS